MSQTVVLQVSGVYTAINDYDGLPPGALNRAVNVESRHKNLFEPRRGFESLPGSAISNVSHNRLTNFTIDGQMRTVSLTSAGDVVYYDANTDAWVQVAGLSQNVSSIDTLAKPRFVRGNQNLYLTTRDGVLSLASASTAEMVLAGIPKGLDCKADATNDTSGFFTNNVVTTTTGTVTSGSPNLTALADTTGIAAGQYVAGTNIPAGTTVSSITPEAIVIEQTGTTTAGSTSLTALASNAGIVAGLIVSGDGIQEGTTVSSITGAGPYTVTLSTAAYKSGTGVTVTFTSPVVVVMSANATGTASSTALTFYSGSQVGYRVVFGRVEEDADGNQTTRLGAPSAMGVAVNTSGYSTNATVVASIPKGSSDGRITFVRIYRSNQTASAAIPPVDEMQLVYERDLEAADFTARIITVTDNVSDSARGVALYTGSDREGLLQANDPPPAAWDMCIFRNMALYGNITQPSTLSLTLGGVGAPNGLQSGDQITITYGTDTSTYTGGATEVLASKQFKVYTTGTSSQNITDTANSLIRVINYDEDVPVHAILISSTTDLPGQMLLECDSPYGTFTATMSAHTSAFDPPLSNLQSDVNVVKNGIGVSKLNELEAVPATSVLSAGDSSSPIYRVIALRDYAIVLKGDGVYKVQGTEPSNLICSPFDLTAKIIGPDTAVALNSGVWMLSNQGVVSISDAGLNQISFPIDDQLNELIGSQLDSLNTVAFAVGYESDRKYILSIPSTTVTTKTVKQWVYNYVTSSWTSWDRALFSAFVHSEDDKLYIGRADTDNYGVSVERKSGTYQDYSDEALSVTISAKSGTTVTLNDVTGIEVGDILYQTSTKASLIVSIDTDNNQVETDVTINWSLASASVLKAIATEITWKQVFGNNPAFTRQFSEGMLLFKDARFNNGTMAFATDFSRGFGDVDIYGRQLGGWGQFRWGEVPWGGEVAPDAIRFLIPTEKQYGSYLLPRLSIQEAWSNFRLQGLAISWASISQEVGK